jgi:hypothetical protein
VTKVLATNTFETTFGPQSVNAYAHFRLASQQIKHLWVCFEQATKGEQIIYIDELVQALGQQSTLPSEKRWDWEHQ